MNSKQKQKKNYCKNTNDIEWPSKLLLKCPKQMGPEQKSMTNK